MNQTRRQFVRTLFLGSQALAVGSIFPQSLFGRDGDDGGLSFLVVGDWGRRGEERQVEVATQMGLEAAACKARFVISVGDNFYEDGVESITDSHWKQSFEDIYSAPALQVPWHVVLGNHDYHGKCDAQIDFSKVDKRWNMPARYFRQTEKISPESEADFFFLDTTPMAMTSDDLVVSSEELQKQNLNEQMAWLKSSLETSKARWKIVIGHHPVYSGGVHGDTPYLIEHVLPLLKKHGVQAYFNGHDHDLQHLESEGVSFFCSGAGSKVRETTKIPFTKFARGGISGFISAALKPDQMTLRMFDWRGRLIYNCEVPAAA